MTEDITRRKIVRATGTALLVTGVSGTASGEKVYPCDGGSPYPPLDTEYGDVITGDPPVVEEVIETHAAPVLDEFGTRAGVPDDPVTMFDVETYHETATGLVPGDDRGGFSLTGHRTEEGTERTTVALSAHVEGTHFGLFVRPELEKAYGFVHDDDGTEWISPDASGGSTEAARRDELQSTLDCYCESRCQCETRTCRRSSLLQHHRMGNPDEVVAEKCSCCCGKI